VKEEEGHGRYERGEKEDLRKKSVLKMTNNVGEEKATNKKKNEK